MKNSTRLMTLVFALSCLFGFTYAAEIEQSSMATEQVQQSSSLLAPLAQWTASAFISSYLSQFVPCAMAKVGAGLSLSVVGNVYENYKNGDMTSTKAMANLIPVSVRSFLANASSKPALTLATGACFVAAAYAPSFGISPLCPMFASFILQNAIA